MNIRQKLCGRRIVQMRLAAGLTQRDVAEALDYSTPQFISNWERGVSLPPVEAIPVLAMAFKVARKDLVDVIFGTREHELAAERAQAMARMRA